MSVLEHVELVRSALDEAADRIGELESRLQDFDCELAACDDEKECGMIALRRMEVAFALGDAETTLRGILGGLSLLIRRERPPAALSAVRPERQAA